MIVTNRMCGRVVISANATSTISLANVQLAGETVTSLTLTQIYFSGTVSIANSSGVQLQANGTDHWILYSHGAAIPKFDEATITVASGSCLVVFDKVATLNANTAAKTGYLINP